MRADGVPVWDEQCKPTKGKAAEQLIENLPEWAGPPVYLEKPHSGMTKMDFCQSDFFGYRGELFRVVRVNVDTGESEVFLRNKQPDQANHPSGGIERPV